MHSFKYTVPPYKWKLIDRTLVTRTHSVPRAFRQIKRTQLKQTQIEDTIKIHTDWDDVVGTESVTPYPQWIHRLRVPFKYTQIEMLWLAQNHHGSVNAFNRLHSTNRFSNWSMKSMHGVRICSRILYRYLMPSSDPDFSLPTVASLSES